MDLLVENTRRPGYSHSQITHSSIIPPHTALGPVPIRSVGQNAYVPLDPNAKLDLCCRKQQVSPVCQAMCNYDTFTDKSASVFGLFYKIILFSLLVPFFLINVPVHS